MAELDRSVVEFLTGAVGTLIAACWALLFLVPFAAGMAVREEDSPTPLFIAMVVFIMLFALQAVLTFNVFNPLTEALA